MIVTTTVPMTTTTVPMTMMKTMMMMMMKTMTMMMIRVRTARWACQVTLNGAAEILVTTTTTHA